MFYNKVVSVLYHSALILTFASCSEAAGPNLSGDFHLRAIDGQSLPVPAPGYGVAFNWTEGVLSLSPGSDLRWFATARASRTSTIFFDELVQGDFYRVEGNTITLTVNPSRKWAGTVSGDVITVTREGHTYKYER